MTLPTEIHSMPSSTLIVLGTAVGYSLHKSHTAAWSEAFPISNDENLLSPDELRIVMALLTSTKIFESTNAAMIKLLMK